MVSNQNQNFYNSYNFIKLSQKYLVQYEIEKASNHDILFQDFNFIYLGFGLEIHIYSWISTRLRRN